MYVFVHVNRPTRTHVPTSQHRQQLTHANLDEVSWQKEKYLYLRLYLYLYLRIIVFVFVFFLNTLASVKVHQCTLYF